jgi:lysyl endopeptidase
MRLLIFTIFFLNVLTNPVSSQISQGGRPLNVPVLKSRGIQAVTMPKVNNKALQQKAFMAGDQDLKLKPFQFAHGFEVNISPETHGNWTYNLNGFDIWQVKIVSTGALSLNLIFEKFNLPYGARLFLFNEIENQYLGAFTSYNNKSTGKFAVSPVAGDELIVQYEVPAGHMGKNDFVISQVNHDFIGILKFSDRRPLGKTAGSCNIDINCWEGEEWEDIKDAVCRIIVNGREICTGSLVNNTKEDQRPYIISAAHCYDLLKYAETSVYTFNYESPYCAPLDGDPSNSVSGALMKAFSDSLDFSLVELSLIPPPEFRPYYAGWDKRSTLPDSSTSIHHPQGDIKKVAYDSDPAVYSNFSSDYTPNGFLKILRWNGGVTEAGSSGGPLFNPQKKLVGTLTGGSATCNNPVNDYYSRFDMAWEFRADSSRQLKYWLDPEGTNSGSLDGKRFYENQNLCAAFTNLEDFDDHQNVILTSGGSFSGYWGGTNSVGITGFAERFTLTGAETLSGISMGIGKIDLSTQGAESEIQVNVYNAFGSPEFLIHSETVKIKNLVADAMNFIGFTETVVPADTFFVGFELSNLQPQDTFVVYQSLREADKVNFFWFKQSGLWYDFKSENTANNSMANVFELVACNVSGMVTDTPKVVYPLDALIYPNPAPSIFNFEADQEFVPENISIFNLIGQQVQAKILVVNSKKIKIDLSGNIPGVYFVRLKTEKGMIAEKVSYIPW